VIGAALFFAAVYLGMVRPVLGAAPSHEFEAPGSTTVRLDEGDLRVIFLQSEGTRLGHLDWRDFDGQDLGCVVRETSTGAVARPRPIDGGTYERNEDVFVGRLEFRAPRTGRYRIECRPAGPRGEFVPLAVGPDFDGQRFLVGFIVGFAACVLGSGVTLLGVLIITRARRPG
jgi:hypothetical protein